jgi:hypothetical protein
MFSVHCNGITIISIEHQNATKMKCTHDHHDLCVKGWIKCLVDRQTDESLYKLSI